MNYIQKAKLVASDATTGDRFGYGSMVSADGNTLIIGSYYDSSPATEAGSAYIFTRSGTTWSEQAKLVASDQAVTDRFGFAVSISADGNTAVVSSHLADSPLSNAGSAYVFTRSGTTWSEEAKLVASDQAVDDYFGISVDISNDGNTVIVGAYLDDSPLSNAGSAYVFTRSGTTWSEEAKLVASDQAANDQFGWSVAISADGNTVIVGAYLDDSPLSDAGSAYIFTRSGTTWSEEAKLVASDQAANDRFGMSVSISGDASTAVVGAFLDDSPLTDAGSAYIFTRSGTTWYEQAKLVASDQATGDILGRCVGISASGSVVVVSAHGDDSPASDAGSAYVFTRTGVSWVEHSKITASDQAASDSFGQSVSVSASGQTILVGAWLNGESSEPGAGSAYIFVNPDWPQEPQYKPESTKLSDPASGLVPVTPSDVTDLTEPTRYLMVATGGDVYVNMYGVGTNIKLPALVAGRLYPIRVSRVYATGTTATGISSFY